MAWKQFRVWVCTNCGYSYMLQDGGSFFNKGSIPCGNCGSKKMALNVFDTQQEGEQFIKSLPPFDRSKRRKN
jgi:DNA-directed RNA polymerase subunit RPC12/RpoP